MKLWYFFKLFVFLLLVGLAYQNRDQIVTNVRTALHQNFPCAIPLTYSLGDFDTRFGVSREDFLIRIAWAEKVWEDLVGKELFKYVESGGDMRINLVYDVRQQTTEKLQEINGSIDVKKGGYESLQVQYETLSRQLEEQKRTYNTETNQLKVLQNNYEREVSRWNKKWGAPEDEYARLERQRNEINTRIARVNASLSQLNKTITATNALGRQINELVWELKLDVETYNTTRQAQWEEFSEWEYVYDEAWKRINIYEFSTALKLSRVLIHELGHAVQMGHVDDTESIMYRLNAGKSEVPTEADRAELLRSCRMK